MATTKCNAVCTNENHEGENPLDLLPRCDLEQGHDKDQFGPTVLEPTGDGEFITTPSWYISASPHQCVDCYEEMIAAAEAAYERAYYRE